MLRSRVPQLAALSVAVLVAAVAVAVVAVAIRPGPLRPGPLRPGPPPVGPTLFQQPVGNAPRLARGSAAMVRASIAPFRGSANLATSADWGIPVVYAKPTDPLRRIAGFAWSAAGGRSALHFRIPNGARPSSGSDHHLTVIDGNRQLDLWVARRQRDGSWKAGAWAVFPRGADVAGRSAATASGFALTAGLVRPEEIAAGHIDHALLLTTPYVRNRHVAPAVSGDGQRADPRALPMGSRLQLDPSADISQLPRTERIVAQALKDYGAYVGDSSGSLSIRAESGVDGSGWAAGARDSSLRAIPWGRLRVIAPPRG